MNTNKLFAWRAFVVISAATSAFLTVKMLVDWMGNGGVLALVSMIAIGVVLEFAKTLFFEHSIDSLVKRGVSMISLTVGATALVFLGLSALASSSFMQGMDSALERSSVENSIAYQTASRENPLLLTEIENGHLEIKSLREAGEDKAADRLEKRLERKHAKLTANTTLASSQQFQSPTKTVIRALGLSPAQVTWIYWIIALGIEFCQVVGLLVLKTSVPVAPHSPARSQATGSDPGIREYRELQVPTEYPKLALVSDTPNTPMVEREREEIRTYGETIESMATRAVAFLEKGCKPSYEALRSQLKRSNRAMPGVFDELRKWGVLKLDGNKHIYLRQETGT